MRFGGRWGSSVTRPMQWIAVLVVTWMATKTDFDNVDHPRHYTAHPSGVEAIQVTEHFNFCIGNAIKYLWRADEKGRPLEDLKKARWYIDREIARRCNRGIDDEFA